MSPARTRDPREPADQERRPAGAVPAPPLPSRRAGLTPERVLALQRAGAGNRAISRVLARVEGEEEVEEAETTEEVGGGGGQPLLLTDRPWSEMFPPPLPLAQPAFDLELPIIIPRAFIPPEWLWLFDFQAPPPKPGPPAAPLMIEYKPLVPEEPEQVEAEVEAPVEPVVEVATDSTPKKPRKPRKKKAKKPLEEQAQPVSAPAAAKTTAAPAKKQDAPGKGAQSIDDLMSWIDAPEPGTKAKKGKGPAPTAPAPKKKTAAQKKHEKELAAVKKAKDAEAVRLDELAALREAADKLAETELRGAFIAKLGIQKTSLITARDGLAHGVKYDAIYDEADAEVTALGAYLAGPGKTANSATLAAKSDAVAALISKVTHFKPAMTPAELVVHRRQQVFNEAIENVPLCFQQNKWEGRFGPSTSFGLDKNDDILFNMIRAHFGRNVNLIPGQDSKPYPTKTATSQVYYYVTQKSNTPYVAYDITAHVWDNGVQGETVHVLHIPHNA